MLVASKIPLDTASRAWVAPTATVVAQSPVAPNGTWYIADAVARVTGGCDDGCDDACQIEACPTPEIPRSRTRYTATTPGGSPVLSSARRAADGDLMVFGTIEHLHNVDAWVTRMATPAATVVQVRTLLTHAPAEVGARLHVEEDCSFTLQGALIEGVKE